MAAGELTDLVIKELRAHMMVCAATAAALTSLVSRSLTPATGGKRGNLHVQLRSRVQSDYFLGF